MGINTVWLNPIYPSSGTDNGYDITDYLNIDETLGSMQDFDELKDKLHENGLYCSILNLLIYYYPSTNLILKEWK